MKELLYVVCKGKLDFSKYVELDGLGYFMSYELDNIGKVMLLGHQSDNKILSVENSYPPFAIPSITYTDTMPLHTRDLGDHEDGKIIVVHHNEFNTIGADKWYVLTKDKLPNMYGATQETMHFIEGV